MRERDARAVFDFLLRHLDRERVRMLELVDCDGTVHAHLAMPIVPETWFRAGAMAIP